MDSRSGQDSGGPCRPAKEVLSLSSEPRKLLQGMTIKVYFMKRWTELQYGERIGQKVEKKVKDHWPIMEQFRRQ